MNHWIGIDFCDAFQNAIAEFLPRAHADVPQESCMPPG
jgi:hypothetical protein